MKQGQISMFWNTHHIDDNTAIAFGTTRKTPIHRRKPMTHNQIGSCGDDDHTRTRFGESQSRHDSGSSTGNRHGDGHDHLVYGDDAYQLDSGNVGLSLNLGRIG